MASNLYLVHQNIIWRVQTCTTQLSRGTLPATFQYLDDAPAEVSVPRGFTVRRPRSELPDHASQYWRQGDHHFLVEVYYGPQFKPSALGEIVDQDRHSLIKALRDPSSWVGYDATHTTDDIGLKARWPEPDEVIKRGSLTVLRLPFRCKVREDE